MSGSAEPRCGIDDIIERAYSALNQTGYSQTLIPAIQDALADYNNRTIVILGKQQRTELERIVDAISESRTSDVIVVESPEEALKKWKGCDYSGINVIVYNPNETWAMPFVNLKYLVDQKGLTVMVPSHEKPDTYGFLTRYFIELIENVTRTRRVYGNELTPEEVARYTEILEVNAGNIRSHSLKHRFYMLIDRPGALIAQLMAEHEPERLEEAALLLEDEIGVGSRHVGAVFFGEEQAGAGSYVVSERQLSSGGGRVFGYKRILDVKAAVTSKKVRDFFLEDEKRNRKRARDAGDEAPLLLRARIRIPRIVRIIPKVGNHAAEILEYSGTSIAELVNKKFPEGFEGSGNTAADRFRKETIGLHIERFGYFRATPYAMINNVISPEYYTEKETRALRIICSVFGIILSEEQYAALARANEYLNAALRIGNYNIGIRRDLIWENVGYAIGDVLPSFDSVLEASIKNDHIHTSKLREMWRDYDFEMATVLVPLYHDLSHVEESPIIPLSNDEAKRYLALALLEEGMFRALNEEDIGKALRISGQIDGLFRAEDMAPESIAGFNRYIAEVGSLNRPLLNRYRDHSGAFEAITRHLPRIHVRMANASPGDSSSAEDLTRRLGQAANHLWHYLRRNVHWTDLSIRAATKQNSPSAVERADLRFLRDITGKIAQTRELDTDAITALWDGY